MITPTIGRIVHFHAASWDSIGQHDKTQPLAAMIVYVHDDRRVNLAIFSQEGVSQHRTSVRLIQSEDERIGDDMSYCEWPPQPYRKMKLEIEKAAEQEMTMLHPYGGRDFKDFMQWIDGIPDQTDGVPHALCETGEPYQEFISGVPYRPGEIDAKEAEHFACWSMAVQLNHYFKAHAGRIMWRIRPEMEHMDHYVVLSVSPDGPDVDFVTGEKCTLDKNWKVVKCYCRLIKTDKMCVKAA